MDTELQSRNDTGMEFANWQATTDYHQHHAVHGQRRIGDHLLNI